MRSIKRYLQLYDDIQSELPCFVNIGFVQVDGREIKKRLLSTCHELVDYMFSQVLEFVVRRANEITKDIAFLIENICVIPETTSALIQIEELVERIRLRENKELRADFNEIAAWMYLLINQRVKFDQNDLMTLYKTS